MLSPKLIFIVFNINEPFDVSFSQPQDPKVLQFDFTGQCGVEEYAEMVVLRYQSCCNVTVMGLIVQTVVI